MRSNVTAVTSLLILTTASLAGAAPPSVDVRGMRASSDPASGLYLEPAASPGTGEWTASLWMSYAYRPITLRDPTSDEIRFDVIGHQLTADLAAGVGVAERAALGFDLPVLIVQTGDDPTPESTRVLGDTPLQGSGLGDLGFVGKITITRPTRGDFGGFALALHERFSLPTGDEGSYLGEGGVTSETRLLAEYRLVAVGAHLAAGVKLRGDEAQVACEGIAPEACPTRFGHELPFGLGFTLRPQAFGLDDQGRITLSLETHGHLPLAPLAPFESARVASLWLGGGVRYALRDVSLLGGIETSLVGAVGSAPLRVVASVAWAPRVHDVDDDGVEDEVDQCLELAEDRDGFQDDDGCPEGDNDEDGVFDDEDRCPESKEDEDGFQDEDGCLDPDNDGDTVLDTNDLCPDEPGPVAADPRRPGCPVLDTDADGIEGEKDKCPDQPEDKDGFQDDDGCPDLDNDEDGIPDTADACLNEKGVESADPKARGCPDPDPDRDTILAPHDKCPDQAEIWNGLDDEDGCPDEDPKKKLLPFAIVKETPAGPALEVRAAVRFTDAHAVDPASAPILSAIASELAKHPTWTVRVGVRPSARYPAEIAGKRAAAALAEILRLSRRKDAGEVAPWAEVKDAPRAVIYGIAFKLRIAQPLKTP